MSEAAINTLLMNRIYRRQHRVYDLTRKFYLLGRDRLIAQLRPGNGDAVLEIGCGTGRNLVVGARRYPAARFYGVDVSTVMLTRAIDSLGSAGLSNRVRVAHGDATGFDPQRLFGRESFDRIFISYSISMIPDWNGAIDRALGLLAPGGELHIVDFGGQSGLPGLFRSGLRRWLKLFHVTPRDGLERSLSACARRRGAMLTVERPYRDYAQYAVLRMGA
jgi:S-adenosylmethionine-diacylgycerolhomoserine-N-methlytransferase